MKNLRLQKAVVLMHKVGGAGWVTKQVKAAKGGVIALDDIKTLMGFGGMAAFLKMRADDTLTRREALANSIDLESLTQS